MPTPRPSRRLLILVGVLVLVAVIVAGGLGLRGSHRPQAGSPPPSTTAPSATAPSVTAPPSTSAARPATTPPASPAATRKPGRPPVLTPGGLWWGVDSYEAITPAALANVRGWYGGATPQFWGRYLSHVTPDELAYARSQGIYVYLIVNDRNCSQCGGGDICGNDLTAGQARSDALEALGRARTLGIARGAVLFKDIEQVSSCRGEPSAAYLTGWYRTVRDTAYRTGFYGNVYRQSFDFPIGYCAAAKDARFKADVVLDMNQPEPRLGAPRGSTGPHNAPAFAPYMPSCAARSATVIWQYGESVDRDNYTDIDEARPDLPGLLSPDGGIS